jgi:hypothetical protein
MKVMLFAFIAAAVLGLASVATADETPVYTDTACGSWVNDDWVPNGNCPPESAHLRHDSVTGTITIVKGHLVTVQQSNGTVVINDQPALDAKQSGKVAVGRTIVAYGYWLNNNFYATGIY